MPEKTEFTKLKTGMMSPTGEFYPCDYMGHFQLADELYEYLHGGYTVTPEDDLVREGWTSIHRPKIYGCKYFFEFERHMTNEQKRNIKPVFEASREEIANWRDVGEELYDDFTELRTPLW